MLYLSKLIVFMTVVVLVGCSSNECETILSDYENRIVELERKISNLEQNEPDFLVDPSEKMNHEQASEAISKSILAHFDYNNYIIWYYLD